MSCPCGYSLLFDDAFMSPQYICLKWLWVWNCAGESVLGSVFGVSSPLASLGAGLLPSPEGVPPVSPAGGGAPLSNPGRTSLYEPDCLPPVTLTFPSLPVVPVFLLPSGMVTCQ